MIVTTYTCDRCGGTQNTPDHLFEVGIFIMSLTSYQPYAFVKTSDVKQSKMFCSACCETLGVKRPEKKVTPPPEPPSIEDLIREIANDAAYQAVSER